MNLSDSREFYLDKFFSAFVEPKKAQGRNNKHNRASKFDMIDNMFDIFSRLVIIANSSK